MKNDLLGLIFAENPEVSMGELTSKRALAAVPFGGRYRIIDFILSNMVNSAITSVGITTPFNYQSLTDHLGTGKAWDMDRKHSGLFILPSKDTGDSSDKIPGGVDIIHGVKSYLTKSQPEYALVADCNTLCNIDYDKAFDYHLEQGADVTMIYHKIDHIPEQDLKRHILLDADETGQIRDIHVYPAKQKTNLSYMHMFIIRKDLLMDLVDDAVAHNKHFISKDIFLPQLDRLKLCAFEHTGVHLKIDDIKSFFNANLAILNKGTRDELFGLKTDMPIYTKVKDTVPTKYGKGAEVSNSIVADGCVIEGSVKNCILFRGVHVGKGASLENCIVMQNSQIMDNCMMANVIFDKEVVLRSGKKLIGQDTYPMVIGKGTVV
ncbi:MAG: glucose-1-phosphate adenylyltransferase subunit GlgD [Clostridia bacterium]|nr:glucose-1-phosphate adenylyltransferase subunit GlgD [Clostridia bacterium]